MKIKEFSANETINQPLLIGSVVNGTTNVGTPYLSITFKDSSGTIEGKLWDVKPEQLAICKTGLVCNVKGEIISYRGTNQIKVMTVEAMDQTSINVMDYVMSAPIEKDVLEKEIRNNIASIQTEDISKIVNYIYDKYQDRIFVSPAASKNHHEFYCGLAMHMTGMLKQANSLYSIYPAINRDMLIAGVLLHDVGKIIELGGVSNVEYTFEGRLLGHITISQTLVDQASQALNINTENVVLLKHMILSHHGKYEFGSPVLPMTLEAEALHFIDDIDAKFTMIQKELDNVKEGEFTAKLFSLDNRTFYKHK